MSFSWKELEDMRPKGDWHLPIPPTCRKCDYCLTGLRENRCPECGTLFRWQEVHKRAARTWAVANRLRHANQDSITSIIMGLAGWMVLGLFHLVGWDNFLIRMMVFLIALLTLVLGSPVLKLGRVPKWARVCLGDRPPIIWYGALALLLGFSLLAGVLIIP